MAKLLLSVRGMTCRHCQMKVEKALVGVPGVYAAVVDLTSGSAEVDYDDDVAAMEALTAAVANAGYTAAVAG